MKSIRAKFECTHVIPATENYDAVAHLSAVYSNSDGSINEENKSFSELTPAGQLTISISKKTPANKFFKAGREYYLDFTKISIEETKK